MSSIRPEIEQIVLSLKTNPANWGIKYRVHGGFVSSYTYYELRHTKCDICIQINDGICGRYSIKAVYCDGAYIETSFSEKRALKKQAKKLIKAYNDYREETRVANQNDKLGKATICLMDKENY